MSIFEQVTNTAPKGEGEMVVGPWWCEHELCVDVEDEAMYYPYDKTVRWTCEEGHKNKVKMNG